MYLKNSFSLSTKLYNDIFKLSCLKLKIDDKRFFILLKFIFTKVTHTPVKVNLESLEVLLTFLSKLSLVTKKEKELIN